MPGDINTSVWQVSSPSAWPEAPPWMSFSTLSDLEACPRRWALSAAKYPHLWEHRGYPRAPQLAALEGTVVHLTLQRITSAIVERGCPSLFDESAISTLRELGGYTAIILGSLERALLPYEGNPRAAPVLDGIRQRLAARVPELRSRVQRFLSRIHPESRAARPSGSTTHSKGEFRYQLQYGSHAEVELRASDLGWLGVADFLTLSTTSCKIRDFKTGASKQEHEFQLRTYALLWARDRDLNPSGRLADKLVLSYDGGDVEVLAPMADALSTLEDEIRERTAAALADLQTDPPEARPSQENCKYCAVRHLCEEYWQWHARLGRDSESPKGQFADLQIKLSSRHGPSSWDGVVECPSGPEVSRTILLRTANLRFALHPGQWLRLMNVHISMPDEEFTEDKRPPVVATMGASTEAFLLSA